MSNCGAIVSKCFRLSIFSTKIREPLLVDKDLRQRAHAYLATIRCRSLSFADVRCHSLSFAVVRCRSLTFAVVRCRSLSFAVVRCRSLSFADSGLSYIEQQEEHHRTMTFEEEFRLFLKRYRVAFDERYV
jgi:hypothetical protein